MSMDGWHRAERFRADTSAYRAGNLKPGKARPVALLRAGFAVYLDPQLNAHSATEAGR
jgi:hypothetical protein